MYFLIVYEKKKLYYETFDDMESLEKHINDRKGYFQKKFQKHLAYIVKGETILTAKKHLDCEKDSMEN